MKSHHLIPLSWAFMLATLNAQAAAPAKPAPPPPVQKPSGYKKISDFDDAVHKMAERHTS